MRITIIGSTGLTPQMFEHKALLESKGHRVQMPIFDSQADTELGLMGENKIRIQWADQVHLLWDGRSTGTILDIGMVFALAKPLKIIYLESKTIAGVVKQYAEIWNEKTF